jgi:hypothetical protein
MATVDEGGSSSDGQIEAEALEGAELWAAVEWATSDEAFVKARSELTMGRDLQQGQSGEVAFRGRYGLDKEEIEVVILPFPDAKRPEERAGFIAVARSGAKTMASYCVMERAENPTEPGAVSIEVPVDGSAGEKIWLWTPDETVGGAGLERARKYFKCVSRNTIIGCSLCVTRCIVSVMFFVECMKYCCGAALAFAVISCAVEMMVD